APSPSPRKQPRANSGLPVLAALTPASGSAAANSSDPVNPSAPRSIAPPASRYASLEANGASNDPTAVSAPTPPAVSTTPRPGNPATERSGNAPAKRSVVEIVRTAGKPASSITS